MEPQPRMQVSVVDAHPASTLGGRWEMTRPGTPLAAAALVLIGALLGGGPTHLVLPLAVATGLAVAGANVCNDRCDMAADAVNRPDRPLVVTSVSVAAADLFVLATSVLSVGVAAVAGVAAAVVTAVVVAVGIGYSLWLQRFAFVGEATVALLFAAPVLYGAEFGAAGAGADAWIAFALTAIYVGGREVLKGVPDTAGDRAAGYRTVATALGEAGALWVFRGMSAGFCLTSVAVAVAVGSPAFLVASVICAILPTGRVLLTLRGAPSPDRVAGAIAMSGLVFASGLVPLLVLAS